MFDGSMLPSAAGERCGGGHRCRAQARRIGTGAGVAAGSGGQVRGGPGAAAARAMRASEAARRWRQLSVLLVQASQLDDDLVEEAIDLVLVVALTELRGLEPA